MNYNNPTFWLLFVAVYVFYWRLRHRRQNDLLLVASYVFYGFWDYRFLFLILISTIIDYIGGLGVAGVELPRRRISGLAVYATISALLLWSGIDYGALFRSVAGLDFGGIFRALPHRFGDLKVFA